jgi:hypothetical protein
VTTLALARLFDRMSDRVSLARGLFAATGVVITAVYVGTLLSLMRRAPFDTWGALIIGPVIVLATIPAIARQAKREQNDRLFWLLLAALVLKMLGALLRVYVVSDVYGGEGDSLAYHSEGTRIAIAFRAGDFHTGLPTLTDTDFISFLTGLIYTVTGSTFVGGFMIFSWLGFWGLFYFYRAFTIALPDAKRSSYAILLFFLPSLVFWPSGIGKEAWMVFGLGIAAYGGARAMTNAFWRGIAVAVVGLWFCWLVRPHIAGLMAVALCVGYVVGRSSWTLKEYGLFVRVLSIAVAIVVSGFVVRQAQEFLSDSGIDTSGGLSQTLAETGQRTGKGGSEFTPVVVETPLDVPMAAVTVLFRPFPIEAGSTQAMVASLEGAFLLVLVVVRIRWVVTAFKSILRRPYVAFAFFFVGMFVVAYSSISNFGLLARQRVQVLPVLLVLLCIPPGKKESIVDPKEEVGEPKARPREANRTG